VVYPAIMVVLLSAFGFVLANKQTADVTLLRGLGMPFTELTPGEITNQVRVKIKNRADSKAAFRITAVDDLPVTLQTAENPVVVESGEAHTASVLITLPRSAFRDGKYDIQLRVSDGEAFSRDLTYRLLGPQSDAAGEGNG
jgi:hypothetical protein